MPFDISIEHDLKNLRRQLGALEVKAAPQATVKTLNRLAESTRAASAKHIASQMSSRQAGVKRRINIRKAAQRRLWSELEAKGKPLPLIEFVVGSKQVTQQKGGKRPPARTRVFGKSKTYKRGFIAPIRSGSNKTTMYIRKGKKRTPLRMMFGPGLTQIFKQQSNQEIMQRTVLERFPTEFAHQLANYVRRMQARS